MSETIAMIPPSPPAGDPLIGRTIAGRFRVISKLGEGGMGAVYKAEQLKVNRLCAIKILSASFASDPDALARFNREAQMSSAFSHPHAVTIYDFGDDNGLHYLAMEFVEGETLSSVLRREGPLPLARTLAIARQACAALDAAHRMNIVHRDLKPDNIMLSRRDDGDWVKILDFGIAKMAGDAPQRGQDLTQAGFVVGTPLYMSPEQLAGERLDPRSDIYSLAIIIYQMLTGQLPFAGDNMQSVMVKRLTEDPLPVWKVNPRVAIPPGVEAALMRALQRHRDRRTPTVRDFIGELEAGCAAPGVAAPGATQAQPAAGSTSPFAPGTSPFPGEEAYQTTPGATPMASTPPPSPVATGGASPLPTVAASPPPVGGTVMQPGAAPGQALPPPYPAAPYAPPPPGYPPAQTGFPPAPSVAPAARSGGGVGMILAVVAFVGVLVLGAGRWVPISFCGRGIAGDRRGTTRHPDGMGQPRSRPSRLLLRRLVVVRRPMQPRKPSPAAFRRLPKKATPRRNAISVRHSMPLPDSGRRISTLALPCITSGSSARRSIALPRRPACVMTKPARTSPGTTVGACTGSNASTRWPKRISGRL
ncbi:protein kinase [Chloracidobacterium sp. 2]|nr:serine/threonine-protein kinase [Chloracidobacterium aggregatum]QUV85594.1 protein kinase [Chloracidobacterium sp. 2]